VENLPQQTGAVSLQNNVSAQQLSEASKESFSQKFTEPIKNNVEPARDISLMKKMM